jgi:hypothetical protein
MARKNARVKDDPPLSVPIPCISRLIVQQKKQKLEYLLDFSSVTVVDSKTNQRIYHNDVTSFIKDMMGELHIVDGRNTRTELG